VWSGGISRAKLTSAYGRPAAVGVISWAGVAARAGGKNRGLAFLQSSRRHEENKVEARGYWGRPGCSYCKLLEIVLDYGGKKG
jgi:hypothetical protein